MFMFCVYKSLFLPTVIEALYTLHISNESAPVLYFLISRKIERTRCGWGARERKKNQVVTNSHVSYNYKHVSKLCVALSIIGATLHKYTIHVDHVVITVAWDRQQHYRKRHFALASEICCVVYDKLSINIKIQLDCCLGVTLSSAARNVSNQRFAKQVAFPQHWVKQIDFGSFDSIRGLTAPSDDPQSICAPPQ